MKRSTAKKTTTKSTAHQHKKHPKSGTSKPAVKQKKNKPPSAKAVAHKKKQTKPKTPKATSGLTLSRPRGTIAAPEFVDLSQDPAMPPVWDQRDGSCIAHASLAAFMWATTKGHPLQVSTVDAPAVQGCLSAGRPVVAALLLFESFGPDVVAHPLPLEDPLDSHYVLIVGIGYGREWAEFPTARPDGHYVKVRNSWGTDVHRGGHLLIPVSYLHRHGDDFWTLGG